MTIHVVSRIVEPNITIPVGHMHYNPTTVDSKALWMIQEAAGRIEQRFLADKKYTNLGWLQSIESWWSVSSLVREFENYHIYSLYYIVKSCQFRIFHLDFQQKNGKILWS